MSYLSHTLRLLWWKFFAQPSTNEHESEADYEARRKAWLDKRPVKK